MSIIQTEDKITALYERLSRDDDPVSYTHLTLPTTERV